MSHHESLADDFLLELIRRGDQDGWSRFVSRFQGRMIAYARSQVDGESDAEDLVQETFLGFLRSLQRYRQDSQLETWLFRILRRRIIDHYRSRGSAKVIPACRLAIDSDAVDDPIDLAADPSASPSVRLQQQERREENRQALAEALRVVVDQIKAKGNLRDLMIMEAVFFASIGNRQLATLIDVDEGAIAVVRHRLLKRLRAYVDQRRGEAESQPSDWATPDLLSQIWSLQRPSCPKRTTLGKSMLGILDPPWQQYVQFHVDVLGCTYCQANLNDLREDESDEAEAARCQRIFESTIGFVSH